MAEKNNTAELSKMDGRKCQVCDLIFTPIYDGFGMHNPLVKGIDGGSMHLNCFVEIMKKADTTKLKKKHISLEFLDEAGADDLRFSQMQHRNSVDGLTTHFQLEKN